MKRYNAIFIVSLLSLLSLIIIITYNLGWNKGFDDYKYKVLKTEVMR